MLGETGALCEPGGRVDVVGSETGVAAEAYR